MKLIIPFISLLAAASCAKDCPEPPPPVPPGYSCGPTKLFCRAHKGDKVRVGHTTRAVIALEAPDPSPEDGLPDGFSGQGCYVRYEGSIEVLANETDWVLVNYLTSGHRSEECPSTLLMMRTCDVSELKTYDDLIKSIQTEEQAYRYEKDRHELIKRLLQQHSGTGP